MTARSLAFTSALLTGIVVTAQITLDPLAVTEVCPGGPFDVSFQATGAFIAGTNFIVELSDNSGSFASPTMIGSQFGTGAAVISCTAPPGTDGTGFLVRVRSTTPVMQSGASATALNFPTPDAGMGSSVSVCWLPPSIDFGSMHGGTPDAGGTWSVVSGSGVFVAPQSGIYTGTTYGANAAEYTVIEGGCSASSVVTYIAVEAPNAGINATIAVCSTDPPFSMFAELGGTPDPNGAWTGPNGAQVNGTFNAGVGLAGTYTYVVVGQAPCVNDTSILLITIDQAPNAGVDASPSICTSLGIQNLFTLLGGTPQAGGTWTYLGAPHSNMYDPAVDASGAYVHTVPGTGACGSATATVNYTELNCAGGPPQYNYPTE